MAASTKTLKAALAAAYKLQDWKGKRYTREGLSFNFDISPLVADTLAEFGVLKREKDRSTSFGPKVYVWVESGKDGKQRGTRSDFINACMHGCGITLKYTETPAHVSSNFRYMYTVLPTCEGGIAAIEGCIAKREAASRAAKAKSLRAAAARFLAKAEELERVA